MPSTPLTITQDDLNRVGSAAAEFMQIFNYGAEVSGHGTPDIPPLVSAQVGQPPPNTPPTAADLTAYFFEAVMLAIQRATSNGTASGEPYPVNLPVFTMATLPSSAVQGAIVYCSDATAPVGPPPGIAGGVCYYDGSTWRRVDNQASV